MKSKSASQGHSRETKSPDKDAARSTKTLPKKVLVKRAPIKLRASSGKCVANRTRDKSPKVMASSPCHKGISGNTEKVKSSARMAASAKPTNVSPKKPGDDGTTGHKQIALKTSRTGVKTKSQKNEKGATRRKTLKQSGADSFLDLWALASMGKREASLNASMKVNILYEKQSPSKSPRSSPKKSETGAHGIKPDNNVTDTVSGKGNITEASNTIRAKKKKRSDEAVKERSPVKEKDCESSPEWKKSPGKHDNKKAVIKSKPSDSSCRKRKSPGYKIFKEEPSAKVRKVDKKSPVKPRNRLGKRSRKALPPGHQLCNIIEKCPRQASLVAKAMIAMGQEEETVPGFAARTTVYDWMELHSLTQSETRRIHWFTGFGNIFQGKKMRNSDGQQLSKDDGTSVGVVDLESRSDGLAVAESESLHNTLLRTLHQIGDSRLLKEYLRAQKEDFPGHVDVESCSVPAAYQESPPVTHDPKKLVVPSSAKEKPDKEVDKPEKPLTSSPVKPQPCRAATPVPQFPVNQRATITSSFIHHPVAQPIYPQPHAHSHPQPIKVTPYTPSPTYIYQYAMDRPQGGLYVPPSPSPMPYGSSEVAHRDYTPTYTLNHMGSLSLGRRGMNPYPPAPYNTSLHLPMQQLGFNYSAYYPAPMQTLPQQNMATMQAVPIHQQYPLVPNPVLTQRQIPADIGQLESYQHEYTHYPPLPNMGPESSCMPPPALPPPPPAHRPTPMVPHPPPLRQPPMPHHSMPHHSMPPVSPMESLRSMNPTGVQSIPRSPALDFPPSFIHHQGSAREQMPVFASCLPHHQLARDHPINPPFRYSVTCNGLTKSFSPCKKEHDDSSSSFDCDLISKNSVCNNDLPPRSQGSSRTHSEGSDISDLLHSAHSTMYQIDGLNSMDNIREFHHTQGSAADSMVGSCSPSKLSLLGHSSFSTSYSVSSILDMPACKVKSEPEPKVCTGPHLANVLNNFEQKIAEQPQSAFVCFAAAAGSSGGSGSKEARETPPNNIHQNTEVRDEKRTLNSNQAVKTEEKCDKQKSASTVIIIDDTDGSSDDEPLARLVKAKSADDAESLTSDTAVADSQKKVSLVGKPKISSSHIPTQQQKMKVKQKDKANEKVIEQTKPADLKKEKKQNCVKPQTSASSKCIILKSQHDGSASDIPAKLQATSTDEENKTVSDKETKNKSVAKKATLGGSSKPKKPLKKIKSQPVWPQTPAKVNTNHGWSWVDEGEMRPIPKLTPGKEEPVRIRKCYHSMKHTSGEIVSVRDCVILHSDGDGSIPFVAKVSALWENINSEMMFSMLWYYQPEHTAVGREPEDGEQELFASKHREENSVACIDDKCFVLMYNEYCRLEAEGARQEQGVPLPRWRTLMPDITDDDKKLCRPMPPPNACADNIWFCRYDYDVRKKVVKKPKYKKSNLRYRAPCKPV
ncbi:unnamed protein product [Candidula unifasciata]|uniref:BAH domain-containing protein n=1 Tax=Candidula unifasciata TaxID=100452 RepID=A0A8S3ZP26_9EUPU|nr:unnamed protein product [Candidula unifasciata]